MNVFPEIRNDDILQVTGVTHAQARDMDGRSLFECFLEADKIFEEYQYSCTLAVLSEGIVLYRGWVKHIKRNIKRYKIELHGREHCNYSSFSKEKLLINLGYAKERIENTFNIHITTWYPPKGRKGENPYMDDVCRELGMVAYHQHGKVDAKFWLKEYKKNNRWLFPHMNFHYWNRGQVQTVNEVIKTICDSR